MKKIMVVDDDLEMREILKEIFLDQGYSISLASNGKVALDMIYDKKEYDLVITDINMPVMGGIELTKRIKSIDNKLPVLIITAFGDKESLGRKHGDGFLKKPFELTSIISMVDYLCKKEKA
ncbi:MAG: response regulator [Candidatus Delongbacteria bacterium]|nr:response regulator [Candidatus Delongbacteria bacterium]MBN2835069.1 response regulator [Candidatus Delongbacteria bacterium]